MRLRRVFSTVSPKQAKVLVCILAALVAAVDFALPANINIASLYFICIVLLIGARSVKWLWTCTAIFILLTFGGVAWGRPPIVYSLIWVDWLNRSMIALALGVAAIPVHLRLRAMAERDQAQRALEEGRTQLEARVQERTRDLRASEHSLRQRPLQLMRSQDEERRRLARELHDGVCQYLCYAKFVLQSWIRESQASGRELEVISQATDSLDECLDETRSLSHLLHPPLLDELDLVSATRRYVDGFCRRSPIRVNFTCPNEMGRLSSPVELVLFRIIQESLTNVLRHARSPNVDIELQDQGNQISLTVRDFGKGMETGFIERFNSFGEGAGVGLSGMRERLAELHGKLTVEPCEPGTLIRATLPLEITDSAD